MERIKSYKRISTFIQNESFEPLVSWGLRMAISGTAPIVWGLAYNRLDDGVWVALTAEAISWVEMKGSFNWRVRTLFLGSLLAVFWGVLGTLTGDNLILSVLGMFVAAFISSLLKNLGDRASGLAICVYLLFIICNAFPDRHIVDVSHRVKCIAAGAGWSFFIGIAASFFMPVEQPFRRQIALIWRSIADLVGAISHSGVDKGVQDSIYVREKEVRAAIDHSFEFYGKTVSQANVRDKRQYELLLLRKNAALVAVNVIAIADEMQHIQTGTLEESLRVKAATLFSAMKEAINRISVFVLTLKGEERLLAISHINRIRKLTELIRAFPLPEDEQQRRAINRILQLSGRNVKLLESAISRVDQMGEDKQVFRSYSLFKTMFLLRPRKIWSNVRTLTHFNTLSMRFALRTAIAASLALFIAKCIPNHHAYWLPFSLMIVIQPYFGATLTKAIQRVGGTLAGGLVGSLLLFIPTDLHVKELFLFASFLLMVYYARKNYGVAAFFVTINVVLLFNIDQSFNKMLLYERALLTFGGSLLAVVSGFLFLPAWDKKWLPHHFADAVKSNYDYFANTFYGRINNWTRNKRIAESKNSDVFDSFTRYMEEPGKDKTTDFYDLITCNVRITRDLNTINIEQEEKSKIETVPTQSQLNLLADCHVLFRQVLEQAALLKPGLSVRYVEMNEATPLPFRLNETQMVSLEKLRIELKTMARDIEDLVAKYK